MSDWTKITRVQQHERQVLTQLKALLEFMVDPINVSRKDLMEFAFRLRLAFGGKELWNDVSSLIYAACQDYPVRWAFVHLPLFWLISVLTRLQQNPSQIHKSLVSPTSLITILT